MPLDTSTTYRLTRLRLDGRRWNELRLIQAQISTNPASSGSSYLAMGNTVVLCTVHGPAEGRSQGAPGGGAVVSVVVNIAGFAGIDRKKKSAFGGTERGGDRFAAQYSTELLEFLLIVTSTGKPRPNSPLHCVMLSNLIYTPTSTPTARYQFTSLSSRQTALSSQPASMLAPLPSSTQVSPCPASSAAPQWA